MKQTQYVAREPDAQGFIDYPLKNTRCGTP
jgi:hypothetical protein